MPFYQLPNQKLVSVILLRNIKKHVSIENNRLSILNQAHSQLPIGAYDPTVFFIN